MGCCVILASQARALDVDRYAQHREDLGGLWQRQPSGSASAIYTDSVSSAMEQGSAQRRKHAMSTISLNVDVDALAREEIFGSRAAHLLSEDLRSGIEPEGIDWSHFTPMWRLSLDNLLPENDREQLIRLAHSVSAGEDVKALVKAIQESSNTRPLVVALAGLFGAVASDHGGPARKDGGSGDSLVMVGAIMGAYVGLLSQLPESADRLVRDSASALLSISAACGGAIAATAILQIQAQRAART
jgi:hypothetical protein